MDFAPLKEGAFFMPENRHFYLHHGNKTKWRRNKLEKEKEIIDRNELVDISTVKINTELQVKERIKDYIRQIKNPYCYLDHGMVVRISFAGKAKLEDCLKTALFPEIE